MSVIVKCSALLLTATIVLVGCGKRPAVKPPTPPRSEVIRHFLAAQPSADNRTADDSVEAWTSFINEAQNTDLRDLLGYAYVMRSGAYSRKTMWSTGEGQDAEQAIRDLEQAVKVHPSCVDSQEFVQFRGMLLEILRIQRKRDLVRRLERVPNGTGDKPLLSKSTLKLLTQAVLQAAEETGGPQDNTGKPPKDTGGRVVAKKGDIQILVDVPPGWRRAHQTIPEARDAVLTLARLENGRESGWIAFSVVRLVKPYPPEGLRWLDFSEERIDPFGKESEYVSPGDYPLGRRKYFQTAWSPERRPDGASLKAQTSVLWDWQNGVRFEVLQVLVDDGSMFQFGECDFALHAEVLRHGKPLFPM